MYIFRKDKLTDQINARIARNVNKNANSAKIQQNAVTLSASSLELEKRDQILEKAYCKIPDAPMLINSDLC